MTTVIIVVSKTLMNVEKYWMKWCVNIQKIKSITEETTWWIFRNIFYPIGPEGSLLRQRCDWNMRLIFCLSGCGVEIRFLNTSNKADCEHTRYKYHTNCLAYYMGQSPPWESRIRSEFTALYETWWFIIGFTAARHWSLFWVKWVQSTPHSLFLCFCISHNK